MAERFHTGSGSGRSGVRRVALVALALLTATAAAEAQLVSRIRAEVTPVVGRDAVHPGDALRAALEVGLPEGFHVQSNAPRDPSLIPTVFTVDPPAGVTVTEIVYPVPFDLEQLGVPEPLEVFDHEFAIGVQMTVGPDVPVGTLDVPVRLRYQTCDETTCYPPTTAEAAFTLEVVAPGTATNATHTDVLDALRFGEGEAPAAAASGGDPGAIVAPVAAGEDGLDRLAAFSVRGTTGGYLGTADFLTFISNAENGIEEPGLFEGRGPLAILLLVFLGGLALNLTPCVLPMIPINLAIIGAGAQAGSRRRGFLLGSAYGGAMAAVYGILGLIVVLTTGSFGTINASPWFNLGIAALFVVLGLAMFDVVTIDFSRWSTRFQPAAGGRGTFMLAFSMGAVAALLAGACVAPVVIQVVLFSSDLYATGITAALALPFFLGIGMALPWPIAGAGLARLPRPGPWMVRVKQALGVFILATAAYYGYLSYEIFSNRWVDPDQVASSVQEKLEEGWYADLATGLAAAQAEQKPVLIDMWATWCKNCLTMDTTTMADPTVKAALDDYVKIKFQAEDPDAEPARTVMRRLDAVGLPAYAILGPD